MAIEVVAQRERQWRIERGGYGHKAQDDDDDDDNNDDNVETPPSANPFRRGSQGWGGSKHQSRAVRPVTGSTMVLFFLGWLLFRIEVFCCVAYICSIKCSSQTV